MARPKKNHIQLSDSDVKRLKSLIKSKNTNHTAINRCCVLLALDEGHPPAMSYEQCVRDYGVSKATIAAIVKAFSGGGIDAALARKRSVNSDQARRKVDERMEARLIEIACGPAPERHSRWTIRLLQDLMKVILDEPISTEAIRRAPKKQLRPHRSDYWCIPSIEDADFIAAMEDVLNVYELPYGPLRLVVCMDKKPYQLPGEARKSCAMRPGDDKKVDSEYVRNGTCSIFAFVEPLGSHHHVSVREHCTTTD